MKLAYNFHLHKAVGQFKMLLESLPARAFSTQINREKANLLFDEEKRRQFESVGRIEKINVSILGPPEESTLIMNQNISTPFDCAKHLSEGIMQRAALALVDDTYWDMHSPLVSDCALKFLGFKDREPQVLNKAFWRSCSVMLGAVVANAFKDNVPTFLHSFPSPNIRSGSFLYDVALGLADWKPTKDELRILSAEMVGLAQKKILFEKLVVSKDLALDIFEGDQFKYQQIPDIAEKNSEGRVTLYRVGDHIEISRGPLVADTSFLGRCTITAVHKINNGSQELYRFQGVALPRGIMLNHFAYGILEERAQKLNTARLPVSQNEEVEAISAS